MNDRSWHPQTLLALSNGYWQTCVLHAAVKLDLFTVLGEEENEAGKLALQVGADGDALERLLNALAAMNLLIKTKDRFSCPPDVARFLSRRSDRYLGHIILHHQQLMDSWARLDQAVVSGEAVRQRYAGDDPEWRRNFLLGMLDLAMLQAPKAAAGIDLSGRRRLLDLGGGPGTWAIHFCRENPELEAVVFDLPATRPFAEETIARFGLQERIAFTAGDFLQEDIQGRYDVAWLSHILHGESPEEAMTILQKTAAALEPDGILLVHEFVLDDDMGGPLFPALFSLNMLLGTPAGRSYSGQQLFDLMGEAGFRNPRRLSLEVPGESSIIAAAL